jgi:hypothetical protein
MQTVYLTRRNLLTLLSKLDRNAKSGTEEHLRMLLKLDTKHPKYPCSDYIKVVALEDAEYYVERKAEATQRSQRYAHADEIEENL